MPYKQVKKKTSHSRAKNMQAIYVININNVSMEQITPHCFAAKMIKLGRNES